MLALDEPSARWAVGRSRAGEEEREPNLEPRRCAFERRQGKFVARGCQLREDLLEKPADLAFIIDD